MIPYEVTTKKSVPAQYNLTDYPQSYVGMKGYNVYCVDNTRFDQNHIHTTRQIDISA